MESYHDMALGIIDYLEIRGETAFADYLFNVEKTIIPRPDPKSTIKQADLRDRYTAFIKSQSFDKINSEIKKDPNPTMDRVFLVFADFFNRLLNQLDIQRDRAKQKMQDDQRSLLYNRSDKKKLIEMKILKWGDIKYEQLKQIEDMITDEKVKITYLQSKDNFQRNYDRSLISIDRSIHANASKLAKGFIDFIQRDRKSYLPPPPKAPSTSASGGGFMK